MVYQIIYTSRVRASIDERVTAQIAEDASEWNESQNVTGMLIHSGNMIVQILEGDEDAVQNIYQNVCRDTRHFDVSILGEGRVARREFPLSPMGFKAIKNKDKRALVTALTDDTSMVDDSGFGRIFA